MKQIILTICSAAVLASCSESSQKPVAEKEAEPKVASVSTTTEPTLPDSVINKNWMDYATPGKEHEMMSKWNGSWTSETTWWMAPGAPPSTSIMTTTNTMLLGGRYQQSVHKGSFDKQPFEGIGTLAYDKTRKVFVSTWIDNMGTGIMEGEGTWDEATKSINIRGKMTDAGYSKEMPFREVFRIVDEDHHVMEMYATDRSGKEFKNMEIKFTRKK
ncbi:MAG TPA: DUF1579 domain-containing protein [Flavisolibacter sp.]|nr:DUF1579 domain-containing protein [Flavisolibacter sp.]